MRVSATISLDIQEIPPSFDLFDTATDSILRPLLFWGKVLLNVGNNMIIIFKEVILQK